ncbi:MAG: undecaprenyldiphospho-muramoylpentapeptide beta-N-acetylglucosaminyltransferase [Desulfomicrobium apsheronum]|nr:undecaprenyldiphospho-muramoylpentapeptide beta-N-acetylglucosaminyltransferase [Desulfomicrobium apsheronum]
MKRLILTTGGTGGHIFPALAVAESVRASVPDCEILFVGSERGPEGEWARKVGLPFVALPAQGVLGRGIKSAAMALWLGRSLLKSWRLLRKFKPDVVLGLGGYAGFSCPLAASLMGIPSAIHEQNSVPGVTNRILARRVDRILVSFADMEGPVFGGGKAVVTGNPVRAEIRALREERRMPGRNILIVGGSQGASALNGFVVRELDRLKALGLGIWHQTGKDEFEAISEGYAQKYPAARVEPFISDMHEAYRFADLVICRAGATTIAELTVAGKPSILVPFPYATHDHQLRNARSLEKVGAALVIQQRQLDELNLSSVVGDLFQMPENLARMARAAREAGIQDAGDRVVAQLQDLASSKTRRDRR